MNKMTKNLNHTIRYFGLPLILVLFIIMRVGEVDSFTLSLHMLIIVLGYIAAIQDLVTKKIPNKLVIFMLVAWMVVSIPNLVFQTSKTMALLFDSVLGFALGGGLFLLVYLVSRKGIGGGDVKFMAASGLYLGHYGIIPTTLYASILAAFTGLVLIMLKRINRKDSIPLAPFLYIGILITVFSS